MRSYGVFSTVDPDDRHTERACLQTQAESELEALADTLGIFQHLRGMGFVQYLDAGLASQREPVIKMFGPDRVRPTRRHRIAAIAACLQCHLGPERGKQTLVFVSVVHSRVEHRAVLLGAALAALTLRLEWKQNHLQRSVTEAITQLQSMWTPSGLPLMHADVSWHPADLALRHAEVLRPVESVSGVADDTDPRGALPLASTAMKLPQLAPLQVANLMPLRQGVLVAAVAAPWFRPRHRQDWRRR